MSGSRVLEEVVLVVGGWEVAGEEGTQPSLSHHSGHWKLHGYLSAKVGAPGGQAVWGSKRLAKIPASV